MIKENQFVFKVQRPSDSCHVDFLSMPINGRTVAEAKERLMRTYKESYGFILVYWYDLNANKIKQELEKLTNLSFNSAAL